MVNLIVKMLRPRPALFVFICFLFTGMSLPAQQEAEAEVSPEATVSNETSISPEASTSNEASISEEIGSKYKPREQKLYIDIPLTIAEITVINLVGNVNWRLWGADSETAFVTTESMRHNLNPKEWASWNFEIGRGRDTFLVNQFFHPYAGGLYFASARSNNLNFYWSILSPVIGSLTWEALCEIESPAASDFLNTAAGGIAMGEIMHRLYIEFDKGGIVGKIGSTLLSPTDRLTAAIRGYGPEKGPSKIRESALTLGSSWINARFFENNDKLVSSWNTLSAFMGFDLVYGDPYTTHSKTPFDQFDLSTSLTVTIPLIYNFTIITDGYLASWIMADSEANQASNGVSLHFDAVVIDKGAIIDLNNGRENLCFNANSLDYSIKWRRILSKSVQFSLKTHLGFSPWVITDYNRGITKDDYNQYLLGGNIKLFMELRQINEDDGAYSSPKNGHVLSMSLCFYDTWDLPHTHSFDINTLFLYSKIAYSFPLTNRLSLYAADNFMLLHYHLINDMGTEFPDITRWYNSAQFGIKISF